jgi:hypothetical protein
MVLARQGGQGGQGRGILATCYLLRGTLTPMPIAHCKKARCPLPIAPIAIKILDVAGMAFVV